MNNRYYEKYVEKLKKNRKLHEHMPISQLKKTLLIEAFDTILFGMSSVQITKRIHPIEIKKHQFDACFMMDGFSID